MGAVRRGHIAQDLGDGADLMQMLRLRLVNGRIFLQHDADRAVGARGGLRGRNRLRTPKVERCDDAGEQHGIAQRQNRQRAFGERRDFRSLGGQGL